MSPKPIENYSVDEVAIWLNCIGLGNKVRSFKENSVDGLMLVNLSEQEMVRDLGLTHLQAKKVQQQLDFTKDITSSSSSERVHDLEAQVQSLRNQNAQLRQEVQRLRPQEAEIPVVVGQPTGNPAYAPATATYGAPYGPNHCHNTYPTAQATPVQATPVQATPTSTETEENEKKDSKGRGMVGGMVGGAAGGAAKGAVKGAIFGAIVPGMTAGEGAAGGAAAGAAGGAMGGMFGGRRRRRRRY